MKLTILGATGPTGLLLIEESLKQGHEVTALVRSPDKVQVKHDRLSVQKVDIFKQEDLVPHMRGSDAVMSCLGTPAIFFSACTMYTDSIKVITAAMRDAGVSRFVGITSWDDPGLPWVVKYLLRHIFLRKVLPDMESMEDYLTDSCQDLDYTVARPPQLSYDKSSDKEVIAVEGQSVPGVSMKISRHDLAKFMLKCVVDGQWKKKHVAVGTK